MSNSSKGNGKSKKIVIGVATIVAVAAIAVPTALTLTAGNKESAGASGNETNKYNIIVSTGHESVPDYSLSIEKGTTISELKTLLKAIDGYTITGIYKDEAMNYPYADNEIITSDVKIYIEFTALSHIVNIYAEDGTTLLESQEVSHKDSITLTAPTKPEDNFATYEFMGWYNERNELVNLNEITSDLNIHPEYRTIMKEYKMGYIGGEFKDSISVTIGGTPVTLDSTYHYGAKIVIRATQKAGRDITEFKVKVGSGETQDILTEAYRHEENGQVYYEYELDGNGDLSITYNEAASEYSIGNIPEDITVKRNGHTLSSNETIYYGDEINITYTLWEDCTLNEFRVEGAEFIQGTTNTYKVMGNTEIIYDYKYEYSYLAFTECEDGYEVYSFDGSVTEVYIPTTYHGKNVVAIGTNVFSGSENLTLVILNNSIKTIGNRAFSACPNLTSIELPSSLTYIGNTSFAGSGFISIVIPENVESIGFNSFYNMPSLTSVTIKGATTINESAFDGCPNLATVTIESREVYTLATENYCLGGLLSNATTVKILSSIDDGSNTFLSKYVMTTEGSYNIYDLTQEILSPADYLTFVETSAGYEVSGFDKNSGVTDVVIPATYNGKPVTGIKSKYFSYDGVFNSSLIESVKISEGVKSIGGYAFADCKNLKKVEIPNSVTSLNNYAFSGCSALESITISEYVTYISGYTFLSCGLKKINIAEGNNNFTSRDLSGNEVNAIIDKGTKTLIKGCATTTIPSDGSVTTIGQQAFFKCLGLTSITIPNGVTTIGKYAFEYSSDLNSVIISNSVTSIQDRAFYSCENITEMNYLGTASDWAKITFTSFESNPTYYTKKLTIQGEDVTTINLSGSGIRTLGAYTFYNCENLISVTIPEGVTSIGRYALGNCINLTSFTIPSTVRTMDGYIFDGCVNLAGSITIPDGVTVINNSLFAGCSSLTEVKLSKNLKSIGSQAFYKCSSLASVIIPASVNKIGAQAFYGCSNLTSATFENTTGWKSGTSEITFPNPTMNANNLTSYYFRYEWTRT